MSAAVIADREVGMKAVSKTAYYCCGVRMQDAASAHPVCNDRYAERFMDAPAREIFGRFESERKANAGNVARARIVDDHVRERLQVQPQLLVVTVGAGFDSRPFRMSGGRWIELDEPALIALKNQRLPADECPNPLQRIAIDFSSESIVDKLAALAGHQPVVCIVEGVLLYLDASSRQQLFERLHQLFPQHELICDVMQPPFLKRYARGVQTRIAELGAHLSAIEAPKQLFEHSGYTLLQVTSIFQRAVEWRLVGIPRLVLWFMRTLRSGYAIYLLRA